MMQRKLQFLFILFTISLGALKAQKIVGYYPSYRSYMLNQIEFNKMTDVVFAFLNFNPATGALDMSNAPEMDAMIARARLLNPTIRIHISSGGGLMGPGPFSTLVANAVARANFVTAMANLIQGRNLDGWDMDWEYPSSAADRNGQQTLLQQIRNEFNARELLMCKKLDVSIAVAGVMPFYGNTLNITALPFIDYVHIMAYDCPNFLYAAHSTYAFAQEALTGWNTWGMPYNKMILAVPFYGWNFDRDVALTYEQIANPDPNLYFNSVTDFNGAVYYNAAPTLRDKLDLAMLPATRTAGIAIWEIGQDRAGQTFSLLDAIYQRMVALYGLAPLPTDPCTLPVKFLGLMLQALDNGQVKIVWKTTQEENNKVFVVEKSEDGQTYTPLAFVEPQTGGQQVYNYSYTDFHVSSSAVLYYRIKQVDHDGQYSYSPVKAISVSESRKPLVFPNPSNGKFQVLLYPDNNNPAPEVEVYDSRGNFIYGQRSYKGEQVMNLDLKNVSTGLYTLIIRYKNDVKMEKISITK